MSATHSFSIDFESWAYPNLPEYRGLSSERRKKLDNGYLLASGEQVLELLSRLNVKITFFCLAEGYEWYPALFEAMEREGHEIAYHTHRHPHLSDARLLAEELRLSQSFVTRFRPAGFRAPAIYLTPDAYPLLEAAGFRYSSSTYGPVNHDVTLVNAYSRVLEIPVSTMSFRSAAPSVHISAPRPLSTELMRQELPFGSGWTMGLVGHQVVRHCLRRYDRVQASASLFVHNWQLFPPKAPAFPSTSYLATHPGYWPYQRNIRPCFERLVGEFGSKPMRDSLGI